MVLGFLVSASVRSSRPAALVSETVLPDLASLIAPVDGSNSPLVTACSSVNVSPVDVSLIVLFSGSITPCLTASIRVISSPV